MNNNNLKIKETFTSALQHHQKNNFRVAENLYKEILKTNSNHFESIYYLGTLSVQTKNFDRAKQSLENDEKIKDSDILKKTIEHLAIVKKDLVSVFKKNNIEEIVAVNKKLDPNLHQAMMEVEDENKESGTIVQEIQKGYVMKDRLLRPSLVAVSKKPEKNEENKEEKVKK